jgi:hypothetical protein
MTPNDDDRPELSSEDARLVRRIAEVWAPPEPTAARGTRFDARLAERLARKRSPQRALVLAAALGALALVVLVRVGGGPGTSEGTDGTRAPAPGIASAPALAPAESATAEETLIALASDHALASAVTGSDRDEALPEDYQAIASLLY